MIPRTFRRVSPLLVALLALTLWGSLLGQAASAGSTGAVRTRFTAELRCLPAGGALVTFTIANLGHETLVIEDDFHLLLTIVGRTGAPTGGPIVFVWPAPGWDAIPAGERRTFRIGMGDPEAGELGVDLSGAGLLLEAEVWFVGREEPVRRFFGFRACPPPPTEPVAAFDRSTALAPDRETTN